MTNYIAIIEDGGDTHATGVWFPDLPGCFSAGDTLDEAMMNGAEALALWSEVMAEDGKPMPKPRSLAAIKADPEWARDVAQYMVAVIPLISSPARNAAE